LYNLNGVLETIMLYNEHGHRHVLLEVPKGRLIGEYVCNTLHLLTDQQLLELQSLLIEELGDFLWHVQFLIQSPIWPKLNATLPHSFIIQSHGNFTCYGSLAHVLLLVDMIIYITGPSYNIAHHIFNMLSRKNKFQPHATCDMRDPWGLYY
ncbi:hypothetical protein ACJX0J_017165, partial [Zea mays]